MQMSRTVFRFLLVIVCFGLIGCALNEAWRTDPPALCPGSECGTTFLERHQNFELAFVEFTERGNLFDRARMEAVIQHLDDKRAQSEDGLLVVVFVHGWKHNALDGDPNIESFRELLRKAAEVLKTKRQIIGVYVGWRGLSVTDEGLSNLSYWERKTTAEQVGRGGVSELLLELEQAVVDQDAPNRNLYLVTGHSFGGAIVLSALKEVFLERIVTARRLEDCGDSNRVDCECVETRPFGHGVVLLNPAIEANEAFQLKQAVASRCFGPNQVRLMHVISSDADQATNRAFRTGQWLAMLRWQETELDRKLNGKTLRFEESALDTITVGNFTSFQTGQVCNGKLREQDRRPECRLSGLPDKCVERSPGDNWHYISYVDQKDCVHKKEQFGHIPIRSNEPLAFIQSDAGFIEGHNDVFNDNVIAYLAAIVAESRVKRARASTDLGPGELPKECFDANGDFHFGPCFHFYEAVFAGDEKRLNAVSE